jgi:predicted kinase
MYLTVQGVTSKRTINLAAAYTFKPILSEFWLKRKDRKVRNNQGDNCEVTGAVTTIRTTNAGQI